MERAKRVAGLFGLVTSPFRKLKEQRAVVTDEQVVDAIIQRVDLEGEEQERKTAGEGTVEQRYSRLIKRLYWHVRKAGLASEELVRSFPGEVRAILLMKSFEKLGSKESSFLRENLIAMGMKNVQPGVWVLPPIKTPADIATQEDIRSWLRRVIVKPVRRKVNYVFPFVALVDLKRVAADRKGVRKMPLAKTIYTVLEPEDVVPASVIYQAMKAKGFSAKEIILSGDIVLLASAFATEEEVQAIAENEYEITERLRRATGSSSLSLQDLANLGAETIASGLEGFVQHPDDVGKRLLVEVQFWMRFLGGSV